MTADSTCDLTPELIRKYEIGVVPLSVVIDGEVFHDGVDVTPRDIFRAADAGKSVRTAAVNTFEYKEFFKKQLKKCDQLVHVCLGSGFSSCYSDAMEASREVGNVFVVDSRNLSTGSGLLVLEGLSMIREGVEDGKAKDLLENDSNIDFQRVFVVYSPSEDGLARFAIDTVKSYGLFREVLEAMAGCTICTHCGPDTLGLMFMNKE